MVVAGSSEVEGVAGGELRGGGGYGGEVVFGLRWSPIKAEVLGSSARAMGSDWWRWMGGGVAGCDVSHRSLAVAELAGDEEDGHYGSIHCLGSARREVRGRLGS